MFVRDEMLFQIMTSNLGIYFEIKYFVYFIWVLSKCEGTYLKFHYNKTIFISFFNTRKYHKTKVTCLRLLRLPRNNLTFFLNQAHLTWLAKRMVSGLSLLWMIKINPTEPHYFEPFHREVWSENPVSFPEPSGALSVSQKEKFSWKLCIFLRK